MADFTDALELEIAANTAKVGITLEQAGDILTNNQKLSYLLGFTQDQADDIEANNEKVSALHALTSEQITDIQNNNNKISYTDAELVAEIATKVDTLSGQTVDVQAALDAASSPSVSNPFTTITQLNALAAHAGTTNNPHNVTKDQLSLDQVDNTSDLQKPISIATQNALDQKLGESTVLTSVPLGAVFTDTVYSHPATHPPAIIAQDANNRFTTDDNLANLSQNTAHRTNTGNPHSVTAAQVGAVDTAAAQALVDTHENKQLNPHLVTKHQVGLGEANNTSDVNKPVSTPQQTALDLKVDNTRVLTDVPILAEFTDTLYEHPATHPATIILQDADYRFVSDNEKTEYGLAYNHSTMENSNPHLITADLIGLGLVNNTADIDKPVSTLQQEAIDAKFISDIEATVAPIVDAVATGVAISMAIALG